MTCSADDEEDDDGDGRFTAFRVLLFGVLVAIFFYFNIVKNYN